MPSRAAPSPSMHHARAAEVRRELRVVGDVVAMRQKHQRHAAHLLDAPDERRREPRRIDQDVAARFRRADDQVRPGAEARLRGEAAEEDVLEDAGGKRARRFARVRGATTVPIEAVGQATSAISARWMSSGVDGWRPTLDWSPWSRNVAGAICRQASQSMQRVVDVEIAVDVLRQSVLELGHLLIVASLVPSR